MRSPLDVLDTSSLLFLLAIVHSSTILYCSRRARIHLFLGVVFFDTDDHLILHIPRGAVFVSRLSLLRRDYWPPRDCFRSSVRFSTFENWGFLLRMRITSSVPSQPLSSPLVSLPSICRVGNRSIALVFLRGKEGRFFP